jgi:hypothetical protein
VLVAMQEDNERKAAEAEKAASPATGSMHEWMAEPGRRIIIKTTNVSRENTGQTWPGHPPRTITAPPSAVVDHRERHPRCRVQGVAAAR